jgi:HK97 family phage prohead protease
MLNKKNIRIWGSASLVEYEDLDGDTFLKDWLSLPEKQLTIPMLYGHEGSNIKELERFSDCLPIGVWDKIELTKKELLVSGIILAGEFRVDRIIELIKLGAITGLSTGTRSIEEKHMNRFDKRQICKATLLEISVCLFPCQEVARITKWEEID